MNPTADEASSSGSADIPGPLRRLGFWPSLLCRRFFNDVRVEPAAIEHVRDLAQRGTLVYVMRYRSLVEFLLVVWVLMREGLPVPEFVSDVATLALRPVREILATFWARLRRARLFGRELRHFEDRDRCQQLVRQGRPILIFMRSRAPRVPLDADRRTAVSRARTGTDYLREIVHAGWAKDHAVFLVPLAVVRGRGFRRKEGRFATLVYSVQEAPGEVKRLSSLVWNAREISIMIGKHIELGEFQREHAAEGEERVVKHLARSLQLFLRREERLVTGPTLLPKRTVRQMVLTGPDLSELIHELAVETAQPESALWRRAERYFDEMAANFKGAYFGVLEFAVVRIWPRVFAGLEHRGLEKVADVVREHPVVLVPCHRSHFDYLILSYLFHMNYLSPLHIAAGINLAFWPFGPLARGAGAYFIRRSFEGNPLYKLVFKKYLAFLIREGYTQEFFIEGGRSRTGKILTPKLGMLSALVNTFIDGARRDLYFVPVSINYDRVVEEQAYKRELTGAEKEKESVFSLLRARSVLRQEYGSVYVTFSDPISLADALGPRLEQYREAPEDPGTDADKRRFIQKFGFRILRAVNAVSVAGPTSVTATVLLGSTHAAWRYDEFLVRAHTLVAYLRDLGIQFTTALERDAEHFTDSLAFLGKAGLLKRSPEEADVIVLPAEQRIILDFYKNNTIHFFLLPALVARALLAGHAPTDVTAEVAWWLDLYRWEFALPERGTLGKEVERVLAYFRTAGALGPTGNTVDRAHPLVQATAGILDNFCEAYWLAARAAGELEPDGVNQKAFLERLRKRFATGLLLGEVKRPEANSTVTFENAINRFTELGLITLAPGTKPKERLVQPGPNASAIAPIVDRLAQPLQQA